MQELQFISREKIPVLMLIINNRISGMIKDREKREGYAVHTTYDSGYSSPDFKLIAKQLMILDMLKQIHLIT